MLGPARAGLTGPHRATRPSGVRRCSRAFACHLCRAPLVQRCWVQLAEWVMDGDRTARRHRPGQVAAAWASSGSCNAAMLLGTAGVGGEPPLLELGVSN